jgi:Domain of unknown function (DUF1995)
VHCQACSCYALCLTHRPKPGMLRNSLTCIMHSSGASSGTSASTQHELRARLASQPAAPAAIHEANHTALTLHILLHCNYCSSQILAGFFGGKSGAVEPIPGTDMYVAIIFSCQEMPDLQRLHAADPSVPIVFFNLKLDTQRGDLGLPAFPPKSLHHTFMCKIKPAFLLRTRGYSKSLARPPYLVNYQGAQFRVYPGAYQSLLDVGTGRYKQVINAP